MAAGAAAMKTTGAMPDAAIFIRVDIDERVQQDAELCRRLAELCPVDIFALEEREGRPPRLTTVERNLDECTLCDLCIEAAGDAVRVVKLYRE
jgi:NAD-dependent dihydropyrimidine dehydrogenase PreA subunit